MCIQLLTDLSLGFDLCVFVSSVGSVVQAVLLSFPSNKSNSSTFRMATPIKIAWRIEIFL